jgi:hypothetical protein
MAAIDCRDLGAAERGGEAKQDHRPVALGLEA